MVVLAHTADRVESLMLGGPALAFGIWLAITTLRDRRGTRGTREPEEPIHRP